MTLTVLVCDEQSAVLDLLAARQVVISSDISIKSHNVVWVVIGRVGAPVQGLNLLRNAAYRQLVVDGFIVTAQQAIGLATLAVMILDTFCTHPLSRRV
jgi:hypothetical protein